VEGNEAGHVLVHFDGYEHKYDEWVPAQSHRIQGLARPASSPKLKTSSEKAKDEVAKEFSRYEQVAVSGQNAYKQDAAAAASGTKWDNHKQYVRDEMRGDMEAQKTAARYSNIARLGTPEEVHAAKSTAPNTGKKDVSSNVPQLSVVQAAAQAAANAAASVVDEAKAAVAEVEGAPRANQPCQRNGLRNRCAPRTVAPDKEEVVLAIALRGPMLKLDVCCRWRGQLLKLKAMQM